MAKKRNQTSILTGDLIKSRNISSKHWLSPLRKVLATEGGAPKTWEIFRGDSFQLEVKDPAQALLKAVQIKAAIKRIKHLDVRIAVGIGSKSHASSKITESNGQAFIFSGELLEEITKEKRNLAIRTPWKEFDEEINLYVKLALVIMDDWSPSSAELVQILIEQHSRNGDLRQNRIAAKLDITQSSVSARMRRAYYSEIRAVLDRYQEKIKSYIS
jgi:hypothetical protein